MHPTGLEQPIGQSENREDDEFFRHGIDRAKAYERFQYQQSSPLFFTADRHPLWLADRYRGRSAFLICGGPSFGALDHKMLRAPGVLTMGLNNSVRTFRPNLWVSVDDPTHWIRSIWLDPTIEKFVPIDHARKVLFNSDAWKVMNMRVSDCPNVRYFIRSEKFIAKQFLTEDKINWGCSKHHGGGRSVMLPALRTLFHLGIRKIYLLGCDMNMSAQANYHFDQKRHPSSIRGNQDTYSKLKGWFAELRPIFESKGCEIFNCNPDSQLKAFKFISFKDALDEVHSHMDFVDTEKERTRNLYDTELREKEEGIGKSLTWTRINSPKGLQKCKYCGKKCARASIDSTVEGRIQLLVGCEKSRAKLWEKKNGRYHGNMEAVLLPPLPESEAVVEWNKRFGK